MTRKRRGWRSAERTYRALSRDLARKASEERASNIKRNQDTVCPDGSSCLEPGCIAARSVFARGLDWHDAMAAMDREGR